MYVHYYTSVILHTSHVKVHIIIYCIDTREVYSLNTLNDVQIVYDPSINMCGFEPFEVLFYILYYIIITIVWIITVNRRALQLNVFNCYSLNTICQTLLFAVR